MGEGTPQLASVLKRELLLVYKVTFTYYKNKYSLVYSFLLKWLFMRKWLIASFLIIATAHGTCPIYFNDSIIDKELNDPLFVLLAREQSCPESIIKLQQVFKNNEFQEQISMVANRGRNNPIEGSFSFFEAVYKKNITQNGDFFIGYFTKIKNGYIVLDQNPQKNKLIVEAIAWDKNKKLFNFYELRGLNTHHSRWFYRGDSLDAAADNKHLYLGNQNDTDHFGQRMRCSACHNSGGPILKELKEPHNDWWQTPRELIFFPNTLSSSVAKNLDHISDVDAFAHSVQQGMNKLHFQNKLSLVEQLRPLFCTTEINIESSPQPLDDKVTIPSAFWLNPLLGTINSSLSIKSYQKLLDDFGMYFPETAFADADHPWLTPVKGTNDLDAIKELIHRKVISGYFAEAVLMIDFKHPLFSQKRCELLKLIPKTKKNWHIKFIANLLRSELESGRELAQTLQGDYRQKFTQLRAEYQRFISIFTPTPQGLTLSFKQLIDLRKSVFESEISHNPKGQILEPGFRIIFPESKKI
jgi:hypothetical protein